MMQLYSAQFVVFLVIALIAYFAMGKIRPKFQWVVLLVASMVFYWCTGWKNLFFILFTATSTYAIARGFGALEKRSKAARSQAADKAEKKAIKAKYNHKKWLILLVGLIANFGVLSYIKYWNALLECVGFGDSFMASSLLLPLGLSFYTFQSMGYLIDTYNAKYDPERNYAKFLLFVSFFPQLIQGPINRYDALAKQLFEPHTFNLHRTRSAFLLIMFGLLKKYAIANMLAATVSQCLDKIAPATPGSIIVLGILLYSAQQYADFSGGIDMVRGVSRLFGVEMAENFRQPYFSISLGDFWRRWHISLGAWMRDYVFYPCALTKTMQRFGKWTGAHFGTHLGRTLPASLANILVFFLVGLWHGAEAHFIWWGLYNGIIIALADLLAPLWAKMIAAFHVNVESRGWHVWRIIRTFIVVNIGWYFDRIYDFGSCIQGLANTVFNFRPDLFLTALDSLYIPSARYCWLIAAVAIVVVFVVSVLRERGVDVNEAVLKRSLAFRVIAYAFMALLVLGAFMFAPSAGGFLYANF